VQQGAPDVFAGEQPEHPSIAQVLLRRAAWSERVTEYDPFESNVLQNFSKSI
jgi:hypothetical protein